MEPKTTPTFETSSSRVWYLHSADGDRAASHEQRVEYFPGSPFPPAHSHPNQDEHFEVELGKMLFVVDGAEHVLGVGNTIDIPRGSPHKAKNASSEESAVVHWVTRPALRSAEFFTLAGQLDGSAGLLDSALLAYEYRDVFRVTGMVQFFVPVIGRIARLLGRTLPSPGNHR